MFNGIDVLLLFLLLATSWIIVFLIRDTLGGQVKMKYLVMGWIQIECYIVACFGLMVGFLYFNMQWGAFLWMFVWYRLFRLIFYGNVLHYPKCYSWFSDVSQNVYINR